MTFSVWALPLSLTTTRGITVVFSSSPYLDVSVRGVRLLVRGWHIFNVPGCPIRTSWDQSLFAATPSFSQLVTSFFASGSLGIRRTPLDTSRIRTTSLLHFRFAAHSCLVCSIARVKNLFTSFISFDSSFFSCLLPACQRTLPHPVRPVWRIRDSNP